MTRLNKPRRGGCPHPPEQIRKIVQTNGWGKVSPADSVGASTYFRMQRSPPETRTPPYQLYNLLFTLCDVRFFASLRMTRLYRSRRGGCPHPPEQIRKIVQTNGWGKVSPADSVGASTYFRMQRSPPETRTPPYQLYNLLFTLCDVRFFASLRMTRLYRSRRGGCPHPPEQIRIIVQTNGGGKVSALRIIISVTT